MTGEDPTARQDCCEAGVCAAPVPDPTRADLLAGRANLLGQVARYVAFNDLHLTAFTLRDDGVDYLTNNRAHAALVAESYGCVPQDDLHQAAGAIHESWCSDVLTVRYCELLPRVVAA